MTATAAPELVSVPQLCHRWQVSRATVYRMFEQGLPSVRIGSSRRIRLTDADRWLNEVNGL